MRGSDSAATALRDARRQHLALAAQPRATPLSAAWAPIGPGAIATPLYGAVSGRITALVVDPADASGNTVYLGTTGGGVWKSINAAGPAASVSFVPLTDTLPVFDLSAGSSAIPSLSIGSLAIGGGVLLAGTGDPNDATDSYYGGGILRSTDAGLTWALVTEAADGTNITRSFVGLSVSSMAFSTANPLLVVAGLAQSFEGAIVNAGSDAYFLKGLYVSADAGLTWQVATVMDGRQIVESAFDQPGDGGGNGVTSVVWNPVRQMFFAALSGHGYYSSPDGANWRRLTAQPGAGLTLRNCPTLSAEGPDCPIFRGVLAVQPTTGDTFALTIDANDGDQGLYQDLCAKTSGGHCASAISFSTQLDSLPLDAGGGDSTIAQGSYDLALAASASGTDTLLYVGSTDLFRCSLAAGCVLRNTTNAQNGCTTSAVVAGAQHAIALGAVPMIFLGNDGGLWRSTDGVAEDGVVCSPTDASHFDNLNTSLGSLAEVSSFAQDPLDANTLLAGVGAQGSAATSLASSGVAWTQLSANEGGNVAIDATNPQNWYISNGAGVEIAVCPRGAACTPADFLTPAIGPSQTDHDESLIQAAWMLDPGLSSAVLVGTCRVWRGDAASWSPGDSLSLPFAAQLASACGPTFGVVRSLGAGGPVTSSVSDPNEGSEVLYAGMAGAYDGGGGVAGHLFTTASAQTAGAATAWVDASLAPVTNDFGDAGRFNPGGFDISSVVVDPHDASGQTVYATIMGFAGNGTNAPHLYQSTNGGASWLNVSSNLPNAPANTVVVDPNDANTVYVGLDTGVYVTTAIGSCTSTSCWNVYGINLPNAPVTQLAAAVGMPTGDGRTGELRVATYGRGIWTIPLLTAIAPAVPKMSLSSASLVFPRQQVGTQSDGQTVSITNTGDADLTVSSLATSSDFVESDTCAGAPVVPAASCSVAVRFAPNAIGTRDGVLTVYGNVAGGQATVALTGMGTAPASIVLTPLNLAFGSEYLGSSSVAQNVTISNLGGESSTLQKVAASGDFALTANSCGTSLAPSTGCTVSVVFTPGASGVRSGTLTVNDAVGTQSAQLSGIGVTPATDALAPLALTFAPQQISSASQAQSVTLTNAGDVALLLVTAVTTGDFAVTSGCGATLSAHASCTFQVSYVPKSLGLETGTLIVSDEFRAQTVALSGSGVAPPGVSLAPSSGLTFPPTPLEQSAPAQTVTLTNNGGYPLALSSIVATGDFMVTANNCGSFVAVSANCQASVTFIAAHPGSRTGTLTFSDNAASTPQTMALNGVGVDFTLEADGPTSATIASGATASYLLLLRSTAGVPGNAVFTCSGVPMGASCNITPSATPVYAANGTVIVVTLATGVTGALLEDPAVSFKQSLSWLAAVVPLGLFVARRRRRWMSLLLLLGLAGCSAVGRTIPGDNEGGATAIPVITPSGSYTIVVAGSSAGLVQAVDLRLIVQ